VEPFLRPARSKSEAFVTPERSAETSLHVDKLDISVDAQVLRRWQRLLQSHLGRQKRKINDKSEVSNQDKDHQ